MELIIAVTIIILVPVIFTKNVNKIEVPEFETLFCKGAARASEGMMLSEVSIEQLRGKLMRRNVKF